MIDLKNHIALDRAKVDDAIPSEGDLERFLGKVEGSAGRSKVRPWWLVLPAAAVAAGLALLIFLGRGGDTAITPEEVYSSYLAQVEDAMELVRESDQDGTWIATLEGMTFESVPMMDLLPDEMSVEDKVGILQEHYSSVLSGVEEIIEIVRK